MPSSTGPIALPVHSQQEELRRKQKRRVAILNSIFATLVVLLLLPLVFGWGIRGNSREDPDGIDGYRLPTNVKPFHYDISIETSLVNQSFHGSSTTHLEVLEDKLTSITFHAHPSLALHRFGIARQNSGESFWVDEKDVIKNGDRERVTLRIREGNFVKGDKVQLKSSWDAPLATGLAGYFTNSYVDKATNETRTYASTQFQPTAARRAYPGWDEPALKATFNLTMYSEPDTINLSNMDVLEEDVVQKAGTQEDGTPVVTSWKKTVFRQTPLMASYLLAFANGRFKHQSSSFKSELTGETIPIRVYATNDLIHQTDLALNVTARVMVLLEELFDIPFVLPKLDTLVVANQPGAMENWGLVTGGPRSLLNDPASGLVGKQQMTQTQAHELAHQYFGDLVTMEWWDTLYLNEAFATIMGDIVLIKRMYPEWDADTAFLSEFAAAMKADALRSSHPIEVTLEDPNKIAEVFDDISYKKGGSVLRMLSSIVGEENWLRGVSLYLKKHAYGSATSADLWEGVSNSSGVDVASIAESWIKKVGYPVVTVTERKGRIHLRQDRFLLAGSPTEDENETIWVIPLAISTLGSDGSTSLDQKAFLSTPKSTYTLEKDASLWKLNTGSFGFYRVAYTPSHLHALAVEASKKDSFLSVGDRFALVSDSYALARSGHYSITDVLNLIEQIHSIEDRNIVWTAIATALVDLQSVWFEQPQHAQDAVAAFIRSVFGPLIDRLGFEFDEDESPDVTNLRTLAFATAGAAGYPPVVEYAKKAFASGNVPPNYVKSIYKLAVQHGGKAESKKLELALAHAPNPTFYNAALVALGHSTDSARLDTLLGRVKTTNPTDVVLLLSGVSENPLARRKLWSWFKANYNELVDRFEGSMAATFLPIISASNLASAADAKDIKSFFAGKDTSLFGGKLGGLVETVQARGDWWERDAKVVDRWLGERE